MKPLNDLLTSTSSQLEAPAPASTPRTHPGLASADDAQRRSLNYCASLTREHAGNFHLGMRLMPEPKRSAMFALYALMRRCDDLADETHDEQPERTLTRIDAFEKRLCGQFSNELDAEIKDDPAWPAVQWLVQQYPVRLDLIQAMLEGQRRDVRGERYATFDALKQYCHEVASTVGLLCLAIWGHDGSDAALRMAADRGIALQLTNILRDVHEDALNGRVYLPADALAAHGVSEHDLRAGRASDRFINLMREQIAQARRFYEQSATLEQHIAPDCRATSWAMMRIYHGLLERIARDPAKVLSQRVRLGRLAKATIAGRAWARAWSDLSDPQRG